MNSSWNLGYSSRLATLALSRKYRAERTKMTPAVIHFTFAEGMSLFVNCETQAEVDELWEKLSEGGEKSRCGWLKDKFGVSWQIIPSALGRLMGDKDPEKAGRVLQAMMKMNKIIIKDLEDAYAGH